MRPHNHTAAIALTSLATIAITASIGLGGRAWVADSQEAPAAAAADRASTTEEENLIEDFSYPNADTILEEQGIRLISGDGHLLLIDCADAPKTGDIGAIKVRTHTVPSRMYCFQANRPVGVIRLELPSVYEIRGDGLRQGAGHNITAEITLDGESTKKVVVDNDGSTGVGIGSENGSKPATLLELRVNGVHQAGS